MSDLTRAELEELNECNLCTPWLLEDSDEHFLALEFDEFLDKVRLYRSRAEADALFQEWKRRDRARSLARIRPR